MDGDVQIRRTRPGDFDAPVKPCAPAGPARARMRRRFVEDGFAIWAPETAVRRDETFKRFQMEKSLNG
ncbi:hypothetical protein K1X12_03290 [Hyphomonas sp. WL0036]|uniref:hypothetical protein n=1 Tax=Hyphomonas sediminis TaxID=2866160 RepID=UPI001C817226|nr:hypothetical protein [Hyphomonas sediminis]MBY9065904.1 hypothetical protein [Hyphomonas sediminis]